MEAPIRVLLTATVQNVHWGATRRSRKELKWHAVQSVLRT
jgi:hypothetical protein